MPSSPTKNTFKIDWLLLVAAIAHAPMGIEYSLRMWRTGHYQFFPFLFAVVGWLAFDRLGGTKPESQPRSWIGYGLIGLNMLLLAISIVLYSSTVWMLSFLFFVLVLVFDKFGIRGCAIVAPAWLLLLIVFPLPAGLDVLLINKLQFMASQLASWVLDAARLLHFREGVVLVTEKKQFFAEEACSGIRSLFSSVAAISVYGIYVRHPWWRLAFNVIQTTFWVIVGNALRIAIVVYVADNWTDSIASGAAHELLGFGVFLLIFGLSMSTDQLLNLFLPARRRESRTVPPADRDDVASDLAESQGNQPQPLEGNRKLNLAIMVAFATIALFSGRLTYAKFSNEQLRESSFSNNDFNLLTIDDLPATLAGWRRVSFEHKVRTEHSLLAPESFLWTFEKNGLEASISLDSPYYEFHNLKTCYDGLGWACRCTHQYNDVQDMSLGNRSQLTMQNKDLRGLVLFTAFDRNGKLVLPNESFFVASRFETVIKNIQLALGITASSNQAKISDGALPISQVQLLTKAEVVDRHAADLEELFVAARTKLLNSSRFSR